MADLIPFSRPASTEEHAEAETKRKQALFAWPTHCSNNSALPIGSRRRVILPPYA